MDDAISISNLNDFIFCPASIYFHGLYGNQDNISFQRADQINGSNSHSSLDNGTYTTRKSVYMSLSVYSERYNLVGKIDMYDSETCELIERKRTIKRIYDGYIFQLYGQYFCMLEMGYKVNKLFLYSMTDNKKYSVKLPEEDTEMFTKFEELIKQIRSFNLDNFKQTNPEKCAGCIYEPACDRSLDVRTD